MPATRSASKQSPTLSSSQPYHSPHQINSPSSNTKRPRKPAPTSAEIIVLSSDDEPLQPTRKATSSMKTSARPLKKKGTTDAVPITTGDVLEISDSDSSQTGSVRNARKATPPSSATVKDLQRTIHSLQKDLKQSEKKRTALSQEHEKLKRMHRADREELSALHKKPVLAEKHLSELEDCISCEICTLKMWSPYMLPECGHTFCQKCLVDWFNRTRTQYMNANPDHDVHRAALANQLRGPLHNLNVFPNSQAQNQIQAILANLKRMQPEYTCPSCRKEVTSRPVEDFRLKAVVRQIAELMGEKSSPKAGPRNRPVSNPFDTFFPTPPVSR